MEKEAPKVTVEVGQKSCQTSFTTSAMQDSGVQFQVDTKDKASQTMTSDGVSAGTSTLNEISDIAVQTEVLREGKIGILEWANLVTSIRALGEQKIAKGAQLLQGSTGLAVEYEERLLAAAMCGTELVDGLINLAQKALKDSN